MRLPQSKNITPTSDRNRLGYKEISRFKNNKLFGHVDASMSYVLYVYILSRNTKKNIKISSTCLRTLNLTLLSH